MLTEARRFATRQSVLQGTIGAMREFVVGPYFLRGREVEPRRAEAISPRFSVTERFPNNPMSSAKSSSLA